MNNFDEILFLSPFLIFFFTGFKSKLFQVILIIYLVFIAGFRAITVGTDTLNYYLYFDKLINKEIFISRYEPLYQLINISVSDFSKEFYWVTFISSILTIIPLYIAFNKNSKFPILSWFVYVAFCYYFQSMNILRQSIAVGWILMAYGTLDVNRKLFDKKTNLKTIIYTLIAFLFHYTAILVVLIYILNFIVSKYRKWYIIQFFSLVFGFFLSVPLFKILVKFLPFYEQFEVKEDYISSFLNLLILNVAFVFFMNLVKIKDKWFNLFFCYIVFTNLVLQLPFASRPMTYIGISLTIFLPNLIINNRLDKKSRPIIYIMVIFYCFFRYLRLYTGGEIFPYQNVLVNF